MGTDMYGWVRMGTDGYGWVRMGTDKYGELMLPLWEMLFLRTYPYHSVQIRTGGNMTLIFGTNGPDAEEKCKR